MNLRYKFSLIVFCCGLIPGLGQAAPKRSPKPAAAASAPASTLQSNQGGRFIVQKVEVKGSVRIDEASILALLSIDKGDSMTEADVAKAVKTLYDTHLFEKVSVTHSGSTLTVVLEEVPILGEVKFEGNDDVDTDDLKKEMQLKVREPFHQSTLDQDIQRFLAIYARHGWSGTEITSTLKVDDDHRATVTVKIHEGYKTLMRTIDFTGNETFSSAKLRSQILSKETAWYNPLESNDVYDSDRMLFDFSQLRDFYRDQGFLDFKIVSSEGSFSADRHDYDWHIKVSEGPRYTIGDISINNPFPDLTEKELRQALTIEVGDIVSITKINASKTALAQKLAAKGYVSSLVQDEELTGEGTTIKLVFHISKTPRIFIHSLSVSGNHRTYDDVVLRELPVHEGDVYNANLMDAGISRIKNLNYFETVDSVITPTGDGSSYDVGVNVAEKSTGKLQGGVGFSTLNGFNVEGGVSEDNFRGKGQQTGINASIGQRENNATLFWSDPYFFGRSVAGGFNTSWSSTNYTDIASLAYSQRQESVALTTGWEYLNRLTHSWALTQTWINYQSQAQFYNLDNGSNRLRAISQSLRYNLTDFHLDEHTRDGVDMQWSTQYAGLGGTVSFIKNDEQIGLYKTLFDQSVQLKLVGNYGKLQEINNEYIPQQYRYQLGGESLRGYDYNGIGPRLNLNPTLSYGALWRFYGTGQVGFPVGLPREYRIKGFAFTDFGTTGDAPSQVYAQVATLRTTGYPTATVQYSPLIRMSYGIGLSWESPMGPIQVSWAKPWLNDQPYDQHREFLLSFSSQL